MQTYNNSAFPPLGPYGEDAHNVKFEHDAYDVYVNEEYIGKKLLLTQTEDLKDIDDFIRKQGVDSITTKLEGDHYIINAGDSERVKQILGVYLQNR